MLDLKTESLTKKLASTRNESVGNTSRVTLASSKASSQAGSCGSGDRAGVASWDGIHGVGVCTLVGGGCAAVVGCCAAIVVGCCTAIVVGSGVATCRPALLLSAMVGAALCSVVIGGGESTGVGGSGDD